MYSKSLCSTEGACKVFERRSGSGESTQQGLTSEFCSGKEIKPCLWDMMHENMLSTIKLRKIIAHCNSICKS